MLTSFSDRESGKAGFGSCQPKRELISVYFISALMLTRLVIEKDATWPSTEISFNRFCISESETRIESKQGFLFCFRKASGIAKVDELDPIRKKKHEKLEGTQVLL